MSDDLDLLASEYALGLLEGSDLARAEALEASDPAFRAQLQLWRQRFSEIDATAQDIKPTDALWERIESGLSALPADTKELSHAGRSAPSPMAGLAALWNSLGFWRPAGLAVGAASLVLLAALVTVLGRASPTPTLVAVLVNDQNVAAAVVNAFADGTIELVPLASVIVPEGKALEVWTLPSRERGPVSVALLDRARSIRLDLKGLPRPSSGQLFEITLEAKSGSPIGRPTGQILMKGLALQAL